MRISCPDCFSLADGFDPSGRRAYDLAARRSSAPNVGSLDKRRGLSNVRSMDKSEFSVREILAGRAPADAPVTVKGWVRTRRDSKAGISFVHLSDGSLFHPLQVVAPNTLPNYTDEVQKLTAGCAVEATGKIVPSPAKGQPFEMQADAVKVIGWVEEPDTYPIQPKPHTLEFLREVAHLRPRTNVIAAATRVRHTLAQAIHRFFDQNGFFWINTPIITASDAEGAGALFRVSTLDLANLPRTPQGTVDFAHDFFGRETFLTVSGQLNVEAYCLALTKVYTFGPTFRAENSNTSRHLAEFWMIEPEIAFADLADDATLAEALLKFTFETLLKERHDDLAFFDERIEKGLIAKLEGIVRSEFVRMDYGEAIAVLERAKEKFEFPVKWGVDLQSEHERYLTEKHAKKPVIVMNYPKDIKAFYMRVNDDGRTVAAMDVLAPGIGEIIGGSQREERLDMLDARMTERGIDKEHYAWYRDLRRYGTVPHAGFGLGFERTLAYLTGLANVRDAIPFPRTPGSARY
jgi:asparaginyl-tRNA synthetase